MRVEYHFRDDGAIEIDMDDSQEDQKTSIDISELPPKQAAYVLLRENGLKTEEAAKALDYKTSSAYQINAKLKKYSLTHKKMVKSASKVVQNILDGKAWGSIDKIKDNSALMAAQMVYDRIEPIVRQSMNLNVNADISPVDLSKYLNKDDDL